MEKIFILCFITLTLSEFLSFILIYDNKNNIVRAIKFSLYLFTFICGLFRPFFISEICLGIAIISYIYMYKYNKQYGDLDELIEKHGDNLYKIPDFKKILILSGVCFLNLLGMMTLSTVIIIKFF